jgi:hypothetical protein
MASSSGIKKKEQRPSLAEALHYLMKTKIAYFFYLTFTHNIKNFPTVSRNMAHT